MSEPATTVHIDARPDALALDPSATALIVVDMQNDFAAPGGMFDRAGIPIDAIQAIVEPTRRVIAAGREAGMHVVFLKMQFAADLSDAGAADGPNRLKHQPLRIGEPMQTPDGDPGQILIQDTWNTQIIEPLAPAPDDLVVAKQRYSGFYRTSLHQHLQDARIDTLVFTGATTSVCVESTLRDGFYRDYRCIVLSDCTAEPIGSNLSRGNHEASLLVIETLFGWVSDSSSLLRALAGSVKARA